MPTLRNTCAASLVLAFALAGQTPACADDSSVLIDLCRQYVAFPKGGEVTSDFIQLKSSCAGFINSTVRLSRADDGFCRPPHVDMDELTRIYMAWVDKHPDRLKEPTKVTISAAMAEVYVCPK